jgi:hypothetical protein
MDSNQRIAYLMVGRNQTAAVRLAALRQTQQTLGNIDREKLVLPQKRTERNALSVVTHKIYNKSPNISKLFNEWGNPLF